MSRLNGKGGGQPPRGLHNNVVFALQRKFYHQGIPFIIMPIRV